ncbi:putative ribosomal protein L4/L1e [Rosa chinensis]|uniref:Large ribosomal subunit protein uL4m n=1 Tax=Rosa chinensis TaxID=74649 RepID=A0A2P6QM85_ROSCH|nr:50S ribosomal protein L4 isoform X2 [Rosa chinensis]PRQ35292.1 putative ribosomal protein L4/L1e [Rosa chinensis]
MALFISRRIVRSFGSGLPSGHVSKGGSVFCACRMLSTLFLTHESSGGGFCSDSLSLKPPGASECTTVTKFLDEKKGSTTLASDVFDAPITMDIARRIFFFFRWLHPVVLWQLAKRQQPSNWKESGRASHGTLSDPQLRGLKPRSHTIKNVERLGLKIALTSRAAQGKLLVFEDFEIYRNKPKNIVNYVKQRRKKEKKKKILLVDGGPISEKLKLATKNLHYVTVLPSSELDVDSILYYDTLVMSRDAVNKIAEQIMYTPINHGSSTTYW